MIPNIIFIFFVILFRNVDSGACLGKCVSNSHVPATRTARDVNQQTASRSEHGSSGWHFGYQDVAEWAQHYPECNGRKQSPIDFRSNSMTKLEVQEPFLWTGYQRSPQYMTVVNNGHTVQLVGYWEDENTPYLCGGNLRGEYAFKQLHFHWGPVDIIGSEHTINKTSWPLEMHMVHYKKSYGSFDEAMKFDDGLAVIGVLFKIENSRNSGIQKLQKYYETLKTPGQTIAVEPFPLSEFQLNFPGEYVSYSGSLTTPPCREIVTWIIPALPGVINRNQVRAATKTLKFASLECNEFFFNFSKNHYSSAECNYDDKMIDFRHPKSILA